VRREFRSWRNHSMPSMVRFATDPGPSLRTSVDPGAPSSCDLHDRNCRGPNRSSASPSRDGVDHDKRTIRGFRGTDARSSLHRFRRRHRGSSKLLNLSLWLQSTFSGHCGLRPAEVAVARTFCRSLQAGALPIRRPCHLTARARSSGLLAAKASVRLVP
jgi:hypothetical protein